MWLINTHTLALEYIVNHETVRYAILSHTWEDGEVTYQEFSNLGLARNKKGFAKIEKTCELARGQGLQYAWVDTCCIDKSSSAELSEAINSMYRWYHDSTVCYAYLSDIPGIDPAPPSGNGYQKQLAESKWFTRGWTLQELIAPPDLAFYDDSWTDLGTKEVLAEALCVITGIPEDILCYPSGLDTVPVGRRMSWAARRQTTRVEDMAYCLLGIFDVNMPMIYGEGPKAFLRLQEEVSKQTNDLSLFAWRARPDEIYDCRGALARGPHEFDHCHNLRRFTGTERYRKELSVTGKGLRLEAVELDSECGNCQFISLDCTYLEDTQERQCFGIYVLATPDGFLRYQPSQLKVKKNILTGDYTNVYLQKWIAPSMLKEVQRQFAPSLALRFRGNLESRCLIIGAQPSAFWNQADQAFSCEDGHFQGCVWVKWDVMDPPKGFILSCEMVRSGRDSSISYKFDFQEETGWAHPQDSLSHLKRKGLLLGEGTEQVRRVSRLIPNTQLLVTSEVETWDIEERGVVAIIIDLVANR